ncbi:prolipoprotein diacylglyceryl transferase family protein [Allonocardiopsis opalescens]|uniref:Phosphatidylglycerol--prolipoprotein diacylglyceryl transferase n=1 Tax=Allonocardiopsis opalescens TaxID=1144618 RepID=A0A2T0Q417_9ACTN|nr:prolipoprotein diacylglyceryl transferase family protein [Allonocardiopsis opalescens]PRX98532.1 prolipoprotein diacylglyceryl transferase [Allonocardiopsis opalescens]
MTTAPATALPGFPSPSQGVWELPVPFTDLALPLRAYALCILLGVFVAIVWGERRWRAEGGEPGAIVDIAIWAVPFGLVGGRLYHVITDYQLYFLPTSPNPPIAALYIWNGGLGMWGAFALGGLGVLIACRRRGMSIGKVAYAVTPGLAAAQGIGRWGNYFNQELYGGPTDLPWAVQITLPGQEGTYHPTFLYEFLWCMALAAVLVWAGHRFQLKDMRLFALCVMGYTVGRFWIEYLRIDPANEFLGLRLNNYTSVLVFVGALVWFVWLNRRASAPAAPADAEPSGDGTAAEASDTAAESAEASPEPAEANATDATPERRSADDNGGVTKSAN